jgi:hypothetical protein
VDSLDTPVLEAHAGCLGHLSKAELRDLIRLLTRARQRG